MYAAATASGNATSETATPFLLATALQSVCIAITTPETSA